MGGSLSFTANADSILEPGKKSVVTDKIEGVEVDKLVAGMEKYVRAGKTASGQEKEVKVEDQDGGCLVCQHFEIPALFGGGSVTCRTLFKFKPDGVEFVAYPTDSYWTRGEAASTARLVVHPDNRVEFWNEVHEVRASGRVMRGMMEKVIQAMDATAACKEDADSIGDKGKTSVVSDPIENAKVDADGFLDFFKDWLTEEMGATPIPDGTVVEERATFGESVGLGIKSFAKHEFKKEENRVCCQEYGDDETLTELTSVTYVQAHKEPFRLEQWNVPIPGRRAGKTELNLFEPFVKGVLTYIQENA